jgi:hypothetical protein
MPRVRSLARGNAKQVSIRTNLWQHFHLIDRLALGPGGTLMDMTLTLMIVLNAALAIALLAGLAHVMSRATKLNPHREAPVSSVPANWRSTAPVSVRHYRGATEPRTKARQGSTRREAQPA